MEKDDLIPMPTPSTSTINIIFRRSIKGIASFVTYSFEVRTDWITHRLATYMAQVVKEFYNLIYEYKNDCLVAAVEYNKDYYSDRDVKPNEELFFSLTIVPFSTFSSPKTNQ